jgi:sodium-dependent dicarboxylate transporter 2/3/5
MLPTALSIIALVEARNNDDGEPHPHFAVALLLGIAYAGNIGGVGTLIGTPPNALLAGFLAETYGIRIGFGEWMLVGVPLVLVALPLCWFVLTRVLHPVRDLVLPGSRTAIADAIAALGKPSRAEWTVGLITAGTAAAWVTRPVFERWVEGTSDAGIAIAGATLLFLVPVNADRSPALRWADAERLPWAVLVLFGGGLSLAAAIQESGLATWVGEGLSALNAAPLLLIVLMVTTLIVFLTELTSNTATAATFFPVVGALALGLGEDPRLLAIPTALAASCAFMMPVATPPNAIVFASKRITIPQMVRAGLVVNLLMIGLVIATVFGGASASRLG